ncbi:MAG: DUF2007 domain-containing protein [Pseudomonadota bacterium]
METVLTTNDPVALSFADALLRDAGIETLLADQHTSMMEGSLGILPRRLMVPADRSAQALRILKDADMIPQDRS